MLAGNTECESFSENRVMNRQPRILYVDNDGASREFLGRWLTRQVSGCRVTSVENSVEALDEIEKGAFDLYILEYCLGDMTGPELCRRIRSNDTSTPVIICSALAREIDRNTSLSSGATEYIVKPDDLEKFVLMLRKMFGAPPRRHPFHTLRRCSTII